MDYTAFYSILIDEALETPQDLLLNPENDDTGWYELIRKFESHGGEVLGQGMHGVVLSRKSWNYALKLFTDDVPYLRFVRFCVKNPRPSFPVFYDKPRKIIPHFTRYEREQYMYVVKMEKLNSIDADTAHDIEFYCLFHDPLKADQIRSKYPQIVKFKEDFDFLRSHAREINFGTLDLHKRNIMQRNNGDFVLTDPYYQIAADTDFGKLLRGGEITKRKQPKPSTFPVRQEPNVEPVGDAFPID